MTTAKTASTESSRAFDDAWNGLLAKPDRDCSTIEAFTEAWNASRADMAEIIIEKIRAGNWDNEESIFDIIRAAGGQDVD